MDDETCECFGPSLAESIFNAKLSIGVSSFPDCSEPSFEPIADAPTQFTFTESSEEDKLVTSVSDMFSTVTEQCRPAFCELMDQTCAADPPAGLTIGSEHPFEIKLSAVTPATYNFCYKCITASTEAKIENMQVVVQACSTTPLGAAMDITREYTDADTFASIAGTSTFW